MDRVLLAIAARIEFDAVVAGLRGGGSGAVEIGRTWEAIEVGGVDVVLTGVGKGNAAGGVVAGFDAGRHGAIVSLGICGALPREGGCMLEVGEVVLGTASVYADEGVRTPSGFESLASMGFPPAALLSEGREDGGAIDEAFESSCGRLRARLGARLARAGVETTDGVIASVSVCSGTDGLAAETAGSTGAIVEAMEGAAGRMAALHLSRRHGRAIAFGEVRVVSNNTGDYDKQVWRIGDALSVVSRVGGALAGWDSGGGDGACIG